jgi:hypothetical protein
MSGNWLDSVVLPAHIGERVGGAVLLAKARKQVWGKNIEAIFADGGFAGQIYETFVLRLFKYRLEIVHKPPGRKASTLCPSAGSFGRGGPGRGGCRFPRLLQQQR